MTEFNKLNVNITLKTIKILRNGILATTSPIHPMKNKNNNTRKSKNKKVSVIQKINNNNFTAPSMR